AITVGAILKGAGAAALVSLAALMIVLVGTVAAICVQTPLPTLRRALGMLPWVLRPPGVAGEAVIERIVGWSRTARRKGLLGLEPEIETVEDAFMRRGLQLVVDGTDPERLRTILEVELDAREEDELAAARVIESMGVYAPTLGIIGAVLGLMAVMQNLEDPSRLGQGIAAAFTATVYGIGFANLLFLPAAAKMKALIAEQTRRRVMAIDGLAAVAEGENPRAIAARLQGYLPG
ncbi:MAG: flagellar motor protein, partial [Gammaproteobacteria bacterium]